MKQAILLVVCFSVNNIYAQIAEPSAGVDKYTLQIELEAQYANQNEGNESLTSWSIPSALIRYGLFKGVELQLNVPLVKENLYEKDHLVHSLNKFDHLQFGLSLDLWKQNKVLPEAALMARAIIPFESDNNSYYKEIGTILSLNMSNKLSNKFNLSYNLGYVHETFGVNAGYYVVNLGYELNPKFHFFIENVADFDNSIISQNINTGFGYNFNENMSLDYSIANGINHNLFYTGLIFTWAIKTKK